MAGERRGRALASALLLLVSGEAARFGEQDFREDRYSARPAASPGVPSRAARTLVGRRPAMSSITEDDPLVRSLRVPDVAAYLSRSGWQSVDSRRPGLVAFELQLPGAPRP